MDVGMQSELIKQAGLLLGDVVRMYMSRPVKRIEDAGYQREIKPLPPQQLQQEPIKQVDNEPVKMAVPVGYTVEKAAGTPIDDELLYRHECCTKHLGAASVLLKEAYERAITEGCGDGTAEKVMSALNEHAAMEEDIMPMIGIKGDPGEQAKRLLDATRKFRRAAWDCRITTGQGTVDDIQAAKMWNDILLQEEFTNAKKYPGRECIMSGM